MQINTEKKTRTLIALDPGEGDVETIVVESAVDRAVSDPCYYTTITYRDSQPPAQFVLSASAALALSNALKAGH